MYIIFRCGGCRKIIKARYEDRRGRVDCPTCSGELPIPDLPPGPHVVVGGYLIQELVAEGGMGRVFRALDLDARLPVALKLLNASFAGDDAVLQRFLREAALMENLDHPNIVPASRAGEDEGVWYLAMPFIRGMTLDVVVDEQGRLSEAVSLNTMEPLVDALDYAWREHAMVHRDVKPDNILIDLEGDPHLLDMGLARCFNGEGRLTVTGEVMGTPSYMSPEQARGEQDADFQSDMYSLGASLYFAVTAQMPFSDLETHEAVDVVARGETRLEDPRKYAPDLSDACVRLIARLMACEPAHRPRSWRHVLDDFRRVAAGTVPETWGNEGPSMITGVGV